jgi:mycothiol synthase
MDENRYALRAFRDSDYEALATLQNATFPDEPMSVESLRHVIETFRERSDTYQVVVTDRPSGEVVANGSIYRMPFETESSKRWIIGMVLPGRQREGIGSYLFDHLAAEARHRGAKALCGQVLEDSASGRAFLEKHDFVERRRVWRSSLDVASADTTPLGPLTRALASAGIELTSLAREGPGDAEVLQRVYDLDAEAAKDIPRDGAYAPLPLEAFRQFFLDGENALPDAWFLAKVGGRYVGLTSAAREPAQPTVLQQYFTGTRPEYRRRKIALALKLMLIDYARKNGYSRIETSNDSLNAPMWSLNRGLGFRKLRETIQLDAQLSVIDAEHEPPAG